MYYVKGEHIYIGDTQFYPRTVDFFKQAIEWCEKHLGPPGAEWFYIDSRNTDLRGIVYELPLYIGIRDDEAVTMFKIYFPNAYIEHSSY